MSYFGVICAIESLRVGICQEDKPSKWRPNLGNKGNNNACRPVLAMSLGAIRAVQVVEIL
ncbi:MAG TPA: hypothetical protein VHA33_13840 [Candidatus Angelobacter sp.]|jgi:hypothetical protein|nr:hypothetical protein [Candidatus Angelobacter sp.]